MIYETADGCELPLLVFEPAEGTRLAAGIVFFTVALCAQDRPTDWPRTAVSWRRAGSSRFRDAMVRAANECVVDTTARFLVDRIAVNTRLSH